MLGGKLRRKKRRLSRTRLCVDRDGIVDDQSEGGFPMPSPLSSGTTILAHESTSRGHQVSPTRQAHARHHVSSMPSQKMEHAAHSGDWRHINFMLVRRKEYRKLLAGMIKTLLLLPIARLE
jgi:hypothetical protein